MTTDPLHPFESKFPEAIGKFRIAGHLGGGGMGEVYLGERTEPFSQRVAIKVLHGGDSMGETSHAAMHEETVLVSLDHANIVRLLDRGVAEGGLRYLVMEYVEGVAIDAFCDERGLSLRDRIGLLMQVMDAVAYAHRHLVVHADLKPQNILVTSAGVVKLLDFGIATWLRKPGETEAGRVEVASYTPLFGSPEQRDGGRVMVASDIYSLGAVGLLLLAGRRPGEVAGRGVSRPGWELDSAGALKSPRGEKTIPRKDVVKIADDLEAIFNKAMQPEPEDRYAGVDAFRADLQCYLEGREVTARAANRAERLGKWVGRHRLAAALGLAFICAVALSSAGVVWQTAKAARQRRIAETRLHDLVRLTGTLEGELYDSVNPLANSDAAKGYLLRGATDTLDSLAADDSRDTALSLELAQQYAKLASLQIAQKRPGQADAAAQQRALADVTRANALLREIPARSSRYGEAQRQMKELAALERRISSF